MLDLKHDHRLIKKQKYLYFKFILEWYTIRQAIFLFVITPNSSGKELPFDNRIKFSLWEAHFPLYINSGGGYIWDSCPFAGWMRRTPPVLPGCLGRLLTHASSRAWWEPDTSAKTAREESTAIYLWLSVALLLAFPSLLYVKPSVYLPAAHPPSFINSQSQIQSWFLQPSTLTCYF